MKIRIALLTLMMMLFCSAAQAEENFWSLITKEGAVLTQIAYEPDKGDEYISGDNVLYRVVEISGDKAIVEKAGDVTLPDVSWLDGQEVVPVSVMDGERLICLYCTHSDESYEPSDGTYSNDKRGSIYEIAHELADALEEDGVTVHVSDSLHHPHDAGAYRRSRQTAVALLKQGMSDALLDIHRDGIPNPDEYAVTIGGKPCSKIRLLVGRGNQNMAVNKEMALTIKAVADHVYPGLIKDIYMGKGAFNQDLSPNSLLLECGTYTLKKERVMASMPLMANVLRRALYGGVTGSAGASDVKGNASDESGGVTQGDPDPVPVSEDGKGSGSGMIWLLIVVLGGGLLLCILSSGSLKGGMKKASRNLREATGGLVGKKPEDGEDPQHSGGK